MNKNSILGNLYYYKGKQNTNFRIFYNYKVDNEKRFSKWVHYLDAEEKDINKATHRTILNNEVVLDFDPEKNQTLEELKLIVLKVTDDLKSKNIEYECYSTGSRGFHIHIFIYEMFSMTKNERYDFRLKLISHYGAEKLKANDNSPIALENIPHWKSGKIKQRCFE